MTAIVTAPAAADTHPPLSLFAGDDLLITNIDGTLADDAWCSGKAWREKAINWRVKTRHCCTSCLYQDQTRHREWRD
jgi:hypothetical protein